MLSRRPLLLAGALTLLAACDSSTAPDTGGPLDKRAPTPLPLTPEIFATGLQFPRGMAWAPGGDMFVAEAGTGGTTTTTSEQCRQVPVPLGPAAGGPTSRISRVDAHGHVSVFADGFPSTINAFGLTSGVADVAFVGNTMYALMSGGGCDHGSPDVP